MLAAPQHGFVFLAAAKAASTSIQRALRDVAHLEVRSPPPLKHMTALEFEQEVAPRLAADGFPRDSYVTVALVREPVDLVVSWWRYRSREQVRDQPHSTHGVEFAEFARQVMRGEGRFRRPSEWASDAEGRVLVQRLWKYDHLDSFIGWLGEQIGREVVVEHRHRSPERPVVIAPSLRRDLEAYLAPEARIYAAAD